MDTDDKIGKIRQHVNTYKDSVLCCLDEDELNKIAQISEFRTQKKVSLIDEEDLKTDEIDEDDLIINYMDSTADMFIILEGQAAVYGGGEMFDFPEGVNFKRSVFNILSPGDVCGEFKFMDKEKKPRSANVAVFSETIEYLKIEQKHENTFFQILLGNEKLTLYFFNLFINKIRKLTDEINESRFMSAAAKLNRFFQRDKDHIPVLNSESGLFKIKRISKQAIADEILVSKRTVQRLMIPLEEEAYIKIKGEWIYVLKQFPDHKYWLKPKKN